MTKSARLASFRGDVGHLYESVRKTIIGWVTTPTQGVRTVTLGRTLAHWLPPAPPVTD